MSPLTILRLIKQNLNGKEPLDEKDIIQHFIGGTDEQINNVLNVKNALTFIVSGQVSNIIHGGREYDTQSIIAQMKEDYLVGGENGLIEKDALKQFNVKLFVTGINKVLSKIDRFPSVARADAEMLGKDKIVDYFVMRVVRGCDIRNLVPQKIQDEKQM